MEALMEISFNKFEITHCIPLLCLLTGAEYVESICFASCIKLYRLLLGSTRNFRVKVIGRHGV